MESNHQEMAILLDEGEPTRNEEVRLRAYYKQTTGDVSISLKRQSSSAHNILIQMNGRNTRLISFAYVLNKKRTTSHNGLTRNGFCSEEKAFLSENVIPWGISKMKLLVEVATFP